jgi:DNA-binding transcriptional MerR regulator
VQSTLAIGDFSRATTLSIKTLRHYHRIGILEPADVDPSTGHRRYTTDQIPVAQVIRRFRDLEMPLEEIHAVIGADDLAARNELIAGHLNRLEENLARTQEAAASLRNLLQAPVAAATARIERRRVAPVPAAAIRDVIDIGDSSPWYQGALGELYGNLEAQKLAPTGPAGGIFANELFENERGAATIFVPCAGPVRATGRVIPLTVPGIDLATIAHAGSHADVDRAYGALATYVSEHALAVAGPIREYYLVGRHDTDDDSQWLTEIGWPIFPTGGAL